MRGRGRGTMSTDKVRPCAREASWGRQKRLLTRTAPLVQRDVIEAELKRYRVRRNQTGGRSGVAVVMPAVRCPQLALLGLLANVTGCQVITQLEATTIHFLLQQTANACCAVKQCWQRSCGCHIARPACARTSACRCCCRRPAARGPLQLLKLIQNRLLGNPHLLSGRRRGLLLSVHG